ncbi:hypothetical protein J2P12_08340, partial [Candidatus Bathyarchaeota archaeon]|nr:hypothetical protein [Candidatus Bathyarchaeota archaeon]
MNPTSLTVSTGATGTVSVVIVSLNNFAGTVYLAAFAIPAGPIGSPSLPTVTLNPPSLILTPSGSQSSTMTVSVPSNSAAGNFTIHVEASGGCSLIKSAEVALKVIAPDYSINAVKTQLTISPSTSDSTTLNLASLDGFEGTVSLAAYSATFAVNLSPTSIPLTPGGSGTSTLTVSGVPQTTQPGNYTLEVIASVGFSMIHFVSLNVTVTGATFSLSLDHQFLTVLVGSTNSSTVTVTPSGGYAGTVMLFASPSFPSGVTG